MLFKKIATIFAFIFIGSQSFAAKPITVEGAIEKANEKNKSKSKRIARKSGPEKRNHKIKVSEKVRYKPPVQDNVKWINVSFSEAETQLLQDFQNDLPHLAARIDDVTVFQVRTHGPYAYNYYSQLKGKIETILSKSGKIRLVECVNCDVGLMKKDKKGNIVYRNQNSIKEFREETAKNLGTQNLMHVEEIFFYEELRLRIKVVDAIDNSIVWNKDYSFNTKTFEKGELTRREEGVNRTDSSQLMIGEIAFKTVFSPGFAMVPTIDTGAGAGRAFQPTVDISIGERYDGGRREFGFNLGFNLDLSDDSEESASSPPPFLVRFGPQMKYVFNPRNRETAKHMFVSELGGVFGSGLTTMYLSAGYELKMINRFSISFLPNFILPADVKVPSVSLRDPVTGETTQTQEELIGQFGGLGIMFRANMNW